MSVTTEKIVPRAFVWRRFHSLLGLWLTIYLIEHLVTNSQAALWLGDDGIGFIRLVNLYHSLPYMQVIELVLLGIPILTHGILGISYIFTSRSNSRRTNGTKPSMRYGRSRAYTWQRYTAWILMVGIIFHVIQMRFIDKPKKVIVQNQEEFLIPLDLDEGLYALSGRLDVRLYGKKEIDELNSETETSLKYPSGFTSSKAVPFDVDTFEKIKEDQASQEHEHWIQTLSSYSPSETQVVAVAKSPGTAILLAVRNTFKNPYMCMLYSIFVLAATFHGFNGLWTFLITWGALLSYRSQKRGVNWCIGIMAVLLVLGLTAIWGSYWINLRT